MLLLGKKDIISAFTLEATHVMGKNMADEKLIFWGIQPHF